MNLYFSINPDPVNLLKGSVVLYWSLTIVGLLIISAGIYHYWRYRLSYLHWGCHFVGIIFIVIAYQMVWSTFYVLTVKNQKMYLQYFFPKRTKEFSIREIKSFSRRLFGKNNLYYFLIETRNGRVYSSAVMNAHTLDLNEEKLKKYVQTQLGYIKAKPR